ncbi:MAG: response regulator transcription factor [Hespellia sp.]|nr:response regulator transcription factor [Hespellia sp.]
MNKILLLEDDRTLCQGIVLAIQSADTAIMPCHTKKEAKELLRSEAFELAILDVNLPDGSGLDLLREIRTESALPVILLTANDTEMDIVAGLETGADDYIAKPFSLAILRARVHTQLRRTRAEAGAGKVYRQDALRFDFERMEYDRGGKRLELSKTEQKLLRCLVDNRGLTLPRERLQELVWSDGADYVDENALSVAVKRLRDKLENTPSKPQYIKTVYGIGYQWVVDHE